MRNITNIEKGIAIYEYNLCVEASIKGMPRAIAKWSNVIMPKTMNPQNTSACIMPTKGRPLMTFSCKRTSLINRIVLDIKLFTGKSPDPCRTILNLYLNSKIKDPKAIKMHKHKIVFSNKLKCI